MKTFLLLLFVTIAFSLNAQTLVDTNKVWNVITSMNGPGDWTEVYQFGADTTIGIHQYKKMLISRDSTGFIINAYPIAAREDTVTRQVFFYYSNAEFLAYDFSLNDGDVFTTNINGCNIQMDVDSTDSVVLLNGEQRKRIIFSNNADVWIDGIGSLYGMPNPALYICSADVNGLLNCFKENDTLKYEDPNFTDCFYNTMSVTEVSADNIMHIYPNPVSNIVTLSLQNRFVSNGLLKVMDSFGRLLRSCDFEGKKSEFSCNGLARGMYFFQLVSDKQSVANGRILVE